MALFWVIKKPGAIVIITCYIFRRLQFVFNYVCDELMMDCLPIVIIFIEKQSGVIISQVNKVNKCAH